MVGQLRQQIKQPKPFRSPEEEAFLNVLRTSTALVAGLVDVLRPYDLTQPQYNVLRILRGAGDDGLPSGEVGERMVTRDPDVTRLLDRLEARALVARVRQPPDRRVVTARLTSAGLRLVELLDGPIQELHVRRLGHLTKTELRTLNELLERARDENR